LTQFSSGDKKKILEAIKSRLVNDPTSEKLPVDSEMLPKALLYEELPGASVETVERTGNTT